MEMKGSSFSPRLQFELRANRFELRANLKDHPMDFRNLPALRFPHLQEVSLRKIQLQGALFDGPDPQGDASFERAHILAWSGA
jgi:hypothetical protein